MKLLCLRVGVLLATLLADHGAFGNTLCAYSTSNNVRYQRAHVDVLEEELHQHSMGAQIDINNTEHCSKDSDSCFALWQEDPVNKTIVILTQGCWDGLGDANCDFTECIAMKKPPKALNNTKFCCCSGNLCNINVTDGYVLPTPYERDLHPALQYVEPVSYTSSTVVVIAVTAMTVFIVLALVMYYLFKFYFHPPKRSKDSLHLVESANSPAAMFDFDSLKIQETIGRGRYGTVCHGTLHDHIVAVKMFTSQNKQYFLNERDIYSLPHMEHPSLLKFIGSEERLGQDSRSEYLLVLSFSEDGCLQDYLRKFTVDWPQLRKMSLSIARGLAHLHTELGRGERFKPCIAHRDLTSRNILMKTDGSCMLCDFGFAIRISGSKYFQNGEEQVAETTSLADVGTLRYMAPEILEGAVNLRDCESSLKQIDVYALGLVLWEIATRCSDLCQGEEVSEYKLPFEAEVGSHPSMEQMQILVTRHKARPLFPDIWKDSNPAIRTLKETIEECWDQDAEARLTTLCVEERLAELLVTWERYKAGIPVTCVSTPNGYLTSSHKELSKMQSSSDLISDTLSNCEVLTLRERAHSLSDGTTDTFLSPSEAGVKDFSPGESLKNVDSNAVMPSKVSVPVQPHQGHNPCLERNLMREPVEEITISGNTLLGHGVKYPIDRNFRSFSDGDTAIFESPMLDSSLLVSNDLHNHSTKVYNPIPHLLNAVHNSPKQTNILGNGYSLQHNVALKLKENRGWHPTSFFDRGKSAGESIKAGLKNLLHRKASTSNKDLIEEQQPLKGPSRNCKSTSVLSSSDAKCEPVNNINYVWTPEEVKCSDQLIDTEVCVTKSDMSSTVVRPLSNAQVNPKEEVLVEAEKGKTNGAAKQLQNESPQVLNSIRSDTKTVEKMKRPNSLPLQDIFSNEGKPEVEHSGEDAQPEERAEKSVNIPMRRKNSAGKRKGVKRVKTPFEIKGRFSLYDDRIMSSQEISDAYSKDTVQSVLTENTKFSTSVPLDMNNLCTHSPNAISRAEVASKTEEKLKNGLKAPLNSQLPVIHSLCDI